MFWIYPKADAGEVSWLNSHSVTELPSHVQGCRKGSGWKHQPPWKAGEMEGQMLWMVT